MAFGSSVDAESGFVTHCERGALVSAAGNACCPATSSAGMGEMRSRRRASETKAGDRLMMYGGG
jgi:hypothetical protein